MASRADSIHGLASVSLKETLMAAGLAPELASLLEEMPHRSIQVDPRRPFREPGIARNEVMFVKSGILSKYKPDGAGRRQIVALRFPGEGILPREGLAGYGIQAIVRSEVMVGKAEDFDPIVEKNPELAQFFWRLVQRNEAIGYEWLVNCGRRDSIARVTFEGQGCTISQAAASILSELVAGRPLSEVEQMESTSRVGSEVLDDRRDDAPGRSGDDEDGIRTQVHA